MKLALCGVLVVCTLSVSAVATAFIVTEARAHVPHGAAKDYLADLQRLGVRTAGDGVTAALFDLGYAVCREMAAGTSEADIVVEVSAHQSVDDAAAVVVAAERNLC
ncbi:DUF732 domain-containing protein [Nocardia beijingensis]|uniref:DUF732 domain-containing protein n=1 Tax=Nocardia beijingensis TaxID=95162 RepID=UPI00344B8E13